MTTEKRCVVRRRGASLDSATEKLEDYRRLIRAFVDSQAFNTEHDELLEALQKTTTHLPEEACLACERFLDVVGEDAANIQLRSAGDATTALRVLERAYNQSRDPVLQARCLDLFDKMTELGAYQ